MHVHAVRSDDVIPVQDAIRSMQIKASDSCEFPFSYYSRFIVCMLKMANSDSERKPIPRDQSFNGVSEDDELFDAIMKSEEGDDEFHGLYDEEPVLSTRVAVDGDSPTSTSCPDQVGRTSTNKDSPPNLKNTTAIIKAMFILRTRKEEDNRPVMDAVKPLTASTIDVWEVHRSDPTSFFAFHPTGEVAALEAVDSPISGRAPVRLAPVIGRLSPQETFHLENETGKPGEGTMGEISSVAGAYIALRVDSVDPTVAHLNTYDRETFIQLMNSGDKYTLAAITIHRCLICNKMRQVAMWYTSKAFKYRYYVIPTQGNQVEVIAAKKPLPNEEEDLNAMYRLWTNEI